MTTTKHSAERAEAHLGTTYLIEHIRAGEVISHEEVHNLIPIEGLNHAVSVIIKRAPRPRAGTSGCSRATTPPCPAIRRRPSRPLRWSA